jgi:hypothetical protein
MSCIVKTIVRSVIILTTLCLLAACGGGGGSNSSSSTPTPTPDPTPTPTPIQQTTAALTLSATGATSVALAGVGVTIVLPTGVTPKLNSSGEVDSSVVQVSGAALPGTSLAVYLPATTTNKGKLTLAVASSSQTGFIGGNYALVTLQIAQGTTVSQSDFNLTGFSAIATSGATVTGYTPGFGATIQ